jgi:hypothetical protein
VKEQLTFRGSQFRISRAEIGLLDNQSGDDPRKSMIGARLPVAASNAAGGIL